MPGGPDGHDFFRRFDADISAIEADAVAADSTEADGTGAGGTQAGGTEAGATEADGTAADGTAATSAVGMTPAPRAGTDDLRTVAVISHGAAIRIWTSHRAAHLPPGFAEEHELANTGIVSVVGSSDEGWMLESWGAHPAGGADFADMSADDPAGEILGASGH